MLSSADLTNKRSRSLRTRVMALGLLGSVAAASLGGVEMTVGQGCSAEEAPKPSAAPPLLIGVSLGLTKGLASIGKPLRDAIRVAEGQINASGGLLGRPVVFDVEDDESDEDKGVVERVARDFVAKGAIAVIGPVGSQQVVNTQAIYAAANIIQISPSATSTDLTTIQPAGDRWLFRTTPADDFQSAAVLLFAARTPLGLGDAGAPPAVDGGPPSTCTKLAVVHADNAYGNSMADIIEKSFPKRTGQPILLRKSISVDLAASYADVIGEIMPLQPQCLAVIMYDDVGAPFIREFKADPRYAALETKGFFFIGTDGIFTDGFLLGGREDGANPKGPNIAEGVYGTNPDTQPGGKAYNEFRTLFSSYFPLSAKDAPPWAAPADDAAILIALAIQRAGTATDRLAIRQALTEIATPPGRPYTPGQLGEALLAVRQGDDIDYRGASGAVDIEPNGNVKGGYIVWEAARDANSELFFKTIGHFTVEELLDQIK